MKNTNVNNTRECDNTINTISMFAKPSRFHFHEFLTVCKVNNNGNIELYIQASQNKEVPNWIPIGKYLEYALRPIILNDDFFNLCKKLYLENFNNTSVNGTQPKLYLKILKFVKDLDFSKTRVF